MKKDAYLLYEQYDQTLEQIHGHGNCCSAVCVMPRSREEDKKKPCIFTIYITNMARS